MSFELDNIEEFPKFTPFFVSKILKIHLIFVILHIYFKEILELPSVFRLYCPGPGNWNPSFSREGLP